MNKKTKYNPEPYSANADIFVYDHLDFKDDVIRPGDLFRVRGKLSKFKFRQLAHNVKLDKTWVDCIDTKTGEFRSFYVKDIKEVIRPKKSRRKRGG